uniref:Nicotinate-nucleotide pyrophosphorylase [carboxylating] n=1 Tax=Odontella aurita TaxID=265563 RepID=A0A7S4ITH4_9STRA|mmetsp:Transcript_30096/g.89492  ORF Transcript_30096/g.89492 Transcript_30096/m.89492 type:complete len:315 (+) Transcript_30096:206-1150(+)
MSSSLSTAGAGDAAGAVTTATSKPDLFAALLPTGQISAAVRRWIDDDMPGFDVGGLVVGTDRKEATLWMKSPGVFAGRPFFDAVFVEVGCDVTWEDAAVEGEHLDASSSNKIKLATVTGPCNALLRGERTALNSISRCSGVATASREAVELARSHNWDGLVAGTRKTTPGFRVVEKYGLLAGGAATHRLDLSQMVMLKDNHVWSAGSIGGAVKLARRAAGFSQKIEVECRTLEEAYEAAGAGAEIVMLDNFAPERLRRDAATFKGRYPHVIVEASGGITTETMAEYLCEHVDVISQGKLTQGYDSVDYSLKIVR